ncbi:MAG: 16S rRNA (guanine(527)-N(7))-methyltransferase RsmG [Thermodesulfobacteriota bacterium]
MNICSNNLSEKEFSDILNEGATKLGLSLTSEQTLLFYKYFQGLLLWNQKINLVKRKDGKEIIIKDFLDSLIAHQRIREGTSLLDLGSGAGFPGVPLKIIKPTLQVLLYEASLKKVHFLQNLIRILGINNLQVQWVEKEKNLFKKFDFVVSRAFGSLLKFCQYGLPFVKEGGMLIAMKGRKGAEELKLALSELNKLGLTASFLDEFQLPFLGHKRIIIGLSFT